VRRPGVIVKSRDYIYEGECRAVFLHHLKRKPELLLFRSIAISFIAMFVAGFVLEASGAQSTKWISPPAEWISCQTSNECVVAWVGCRVTAVNIAHLDDYKRVTTVSQRPNPNCEQFASSAAAAYCTNSQCIIAQVYAPDSR
jgi:hypothetical protein